MIHSTKMLSWRYSNQQHVIILSLVIIYSFAIVDVYGADLKCAARRVGESVVCVCNASYCDTMSRVRPPRGGFVAYTSSAAGFRFTKSYGKLTQHTSKIYPSCMTSLELDPSELHQTVTGFGGAFTDSACLNWKSLSHPTRQHLTDSYFSERGIEYNMGRVPMGGTDFSVRSYAYNELPVGDVGLGNFTLAHEDYYLKMLFIRAAMNVSTQPIFLLGSLWSPPRWMKDSNSFTTGYLKKEFYQTLADYFKKFLENYEENGIKFWGITTTNEPSNGVMISSSDLPRLQWTVPDLAQWIIKHLGPTIRNSSCKDVKIIVGDDQRNMIPFWYNFLTQLYPEASKSIDGIGVHFYLDPFTPPEQLRKVPKDKFLIYTEACEGVTASSVKKVDLGNWTRAEHYALNIIEDLNNNVVGWIDWNMCLNMTGGPTLIDNRVDSPIIVSADSEEFYKQPMYYALGHFSKFVKRGSQRLSVRTRGCRAPPPHVAFLTPKNTLVLVVVNRGKKQNVLIKLGQNAGIVTLEEKSFITIELSVQKHSDC